MLSNAEINEIECIFMLIDNGAIEHRVTLQFLEWLQNNDIRRFALLNWMLSRWILLRQNKYHLPKRSINMNLTNLI